MTTKNDAKEKRVYTQTEWSEILGEGIHTGFRKGSEHPDAHKYWMLIRDMPNELWGDVLEYAVGGLASMKLIEVKKETE